MIKYFRIDDIINLLNNKQVNNYSINYTSPFSSVGFRFYFTYLSKTYRIDCLDNNSFFPVDTKTLLGKTYVKGFYIGIA